MDFETDPARTGSAVLSLVEAATELTVVAPFITSAGLEPILDVLRPDIPLVIYTRWKPQEVAAGVSDPSILESVLGLNGVVRLEPRLHAKAFVCETTALVGSSNVTATALGFIARSNLELLVPVASTQSNVSRLLFELDRSASTATPAIAAAVKAAAHHVTVLDLADLTHDDADETTAAWLPSHPYPAQVIAHYLGGPTGVQDPKSIEYDLLALDIPPGLNVDGVRAHIAAMLQQGLIGRVLAECRGKSSYAGIQHLVQLAAEADAPVPSDPEKLNRFWLSVVGWFQVFLGVEVVDGGRGFA